HDRRLRKLKERGGDHHGNSREVPIMASMPEGASHDHDSGLSRRTMLQSALAAAGSSAIAYAPSVPAGSVSPEPGSLRGSPRTYTMKKSINLWAFPYPSRMGLRDCMKHAKDAGFDGIELNYDLENDLSPKAGPGQLRAIRKTAEEIGIAISGLCSFLY